MPGGRPRQPGIASYEAIHDRVRTSQGPAKAYLCTDCGDPAQDWTYDGCDPDETTQVNARGHTVVYSQHEEYYQPRCRKCHGKHDTRRGRRRKVVRQTND